MLFIAFWYRKRDASWSLATADSTAMQADSSNARTAVYRLHVDYGQKIYQAGPQM